MRAPWHREKFSHWIPPDMEWLEDQYLTQEKSASQIAREVGTDVGRVFKWLRESQITVRTLSQALKLRNYNRDEELAPNWRGGETGDFCRKLALEVLQSAGVPEVCIKCGTSSQTEIRLVIHHRDGDRTNNVLDNLWYLCPSCHALVHWHGEEVTRR